MINKKPCMECIVQPMCNKACRPLYDYFNIKLKRMKRFQRYLPVMASVLCILSFTVLANHFGLRTYYLFFSSMISVLVWCGVGVFLDISYCDKCIEGLNIALAATEISIGYELL